MNEKTNQVNINSKKEVLKQYGNIAKVINMMMEENEKTKNKESQEIKNK